eukprot:jgi/Hompol1/2576/HPOL_006054-RA
MRVDARTWIVALIAVVSVLAATKPDAASFSRAVQQAGEAEGGLLWGLLQRGAAGLAAGTGLLRYRDCALFALMLSPSHASLGILGLWLPPFPTSSIDPFLSTFSDFNLDPNSNLDLDSYFELWHLPSLDDLARFPDVCPPCAHAFAAWSTQPTVLGFIPLSLIPAQSIPIFANFGLINIAESLASIDLLFLAFMATQLISVIARITQSPVLHSWISTHLTASWETSIASPLGMYTLITHQLYCSSFISFIVLFLTLGEYAPRVYRYLGDEKFVELVLLAMLVCGIVRIYGNSLAAKFKRTRRQNDQRDAPATNQSVGPPWYRVRVAGPNGWIMALRAFVVLGNLRRKASAGLFASNGRLQTDFFAELWALFAPQILFDWAFGGLPDMLSDCAAIVVAGIMVEIVGVGGISRRR